MDGPGNKSFYSSQIKIHPYSLHCFDFCPLPFEAGGKLCGIYVVLQEGGTGSCCVTSYVWSAFAIWGRDLV